MMKYEDVVLAVEDLSTEDIEALQNEIDRILAEREEDEEIEEE